MKTKIIILLSLLFAFVLSANAQYVVFGTVKTNDSINTKFLKVRQGASVGKYLKCIDILGNIGWGTSASPVDSIYFAYCNGCTGALGWKSNHDTMWLDTNKLATRTWVRDSIAKKIAHYTVTGSDTNYVKTTGTEIKYGKLTITDTIVGKWLRLMGNSLGTDTIFITQALDGSFHYRTKHYFDNLATTNAWALTGCTTIAADSSNFLGSTSTSTIKSFGVNVNSINILWFGSNYKIGIGNKQPKYGLDTYQALADSTTVSYTNAATGGHLPKSRGFNFGYTNAGTVYFNLRENNSMTFYTKSLPALTIDNSQQIKQYVHPLQSTDTVLTHNGNINGYALASTLKTASDTGKVSTLGDNMYGTLNITGLNNLNVGNGIINPSYYSGVFGTTDTMSTYSSIAVGRKLHGNASADCGIFGYNNYMYANQSFMSGINSRNTGDYSGLVGSAIRNSGRYNFTVGNTDTTTGWYGIAAGSYLGTHANGCANFGYANRLLGVDGLASGQHHIITSTDAATIGGKSNKVTHNKSVVLGGTTITSNDSLTAFANKFSATRSTADTARITFFNSATGTTLNDGSDIGIGKSGELYFKSFESQPIKAYIGSTKVLSIGTGGSFFAGLAAGAVNTSTSSIGIGESALLVNVGGGYNIGIGYRSLFSCISGSYNAAYGAYSLYFNTGSNNAAFGAFAGTRSTAANSNRLYINSIDRITALGDSTLSIIYGYQTATTAAQQLYLNANVTIPQAIKSTILQTTVNGTAGTAIWSMPFQGTSYKKFLVYLTGFTSAAGSVITFPTAFVKTPFVYGDVTAIAIATTSTTTVTLTTADTITGFIIIEGY